MDGLNTFYQQSLQQPVATSARQYLEKRGLSHEVIARFAIGFAPPGWDNVLKRFGGNPEIASHWLMRACWSLTIRVAVTIVSASG